MALTQARTLALPGGKNPFARTLGWSAFAEATRARLKAAREAGKPFGAVVALDRSITAELLYYLRDAKVPVLAWPPRGRPKDHYQLTRPLKPSSPGPYLLIAEGKMPAEALALFKAVTPPTVVEIATGAGAKRRMNFARVSGFRGFGPGKK